MTSISRVSTVCTPPVGYGIMVEGVLRHLRTKLPQQTDVGCWMVVLSFVHLFTSHVWRDYPRGKALARYNRSLVRLAVTLFEYTADQQFQNVAKYWCGLTANRIFRDATPYPEKGYKPIFTGTLLRLIRTATRTGNLSLGQSFNLAKKGWDPLGASRRQAALDTFRVAISKPRGDRVDDGTAKRITFAMVNLLRGVTYSEDVASFTPTASAGCGCPVKNGGNLGALSRVVQAEFRPFGGLRGEVAAQELRRQKLYDAACDASRLGSTEREAFLQSCKLRDDGVSRLMKDFYATVVVINEPSKFRILACGDTPLYSSLRPIQQMFLRAWKASPFATMRDDETIMRDMFRTWTARLRSRNDLFALSGDYETATDNIDAAISLFAHELACELTSVPERLVVAGRQALADQVYVFPGERLIYLGPLTKDDVLEYAKCEASFMRRAALCLTPKGRTGECYQSLVDDLASARSSFIAPRTREGKPITVGPPQYVRQTTSQPMGSPLSFFLLCVINLSTLLAGFLHEDAQMSAYFQEWDGDWATLQAAMHDCKSDLGKLCRWFMRDVSARLKINGDDLAALMTRDGIARWREVIGQTGLKESLGKSYVSRRMVMANNRVWSFERDEFVGYFNFNLVYGTSAKKQMSYGTDNQIGPAISAMCREPWLRHLTGVILNRSAPGAIPRAFMHTKEDREGREKAFFHEFSLLPGAQWFFPTWLGGLGVDPALAPKDWKVTNLQRRYAAAALMHPNLSLSTDGWKQQPGSLTKRFLPDLKQIQPSDWTGQLTDDEIDRRYEAYKSYEAALAALDNLNAERPDWKSRTRATRRAWQKAAQCNPASDMTLLKYMDQRPKVAAPFVPTIPVEPTTFWRTGRSVGTVRRWRDGGQLVRLCLDLAVTDQ